jgi:Dictyostelium (slime mold) repeat
MRTLTLLCFGATLFGAATAGATVANDICAPSANPCIVARDITLTANSVLDFGTRALQITSAGSLDAVDSSMVIFAGSVVLQAGARVLTAGGDVDVTTTGGIQVLTGSKVAKIDTSGPDGGAITLEADGPVQIDGDLRADATSVIGDGSFIDVTGSTITVGPSARLFARGGRTGFGDDISLTANGSITVGGDLDASGGDSGGTITIDGGDFVFQATGVFDVRSGEGGSGAEIDVDAFGNVTMNGLIDGTASGNIDLGGGIGADMFIFATGDILLNSKTDLSGNGPDGEGGLLDVETDGDIIQTVAIVSAGSGGYGGIASLATSAGDITAKDIDASGSEGGGEIDLIGNEAVSITGKLIADGPVAIISVTGCGIDVTTTGSLSSKGTNGKNTFLARGRLMVRGAVTAGTSNRLEFRDASLPPLITAPVVPSTAPVLNTALPPCGPPPPPTTTTTMPPTTTTTTSTTTTSSPPVTTTTTSNPPTTTTTTSTTSTTAPPATTTTTTAPPATTTTTTAPPATTTTTTAPPVTTTTTAPPVTTTTTAPPATTTTTSTTSSTIVVPTTTVPVTTTTTSEPSVTTTSTSTTTVTIPTTSTTTVPVPTTSTSTSTSSTTTSVSTTSTTAPPACDPASPTACQDGNSCTRDSCDPTLGCVHTPVVGVDAVSCRLGELLETTGPIPDTELGGAQAKNRLTKRLSHALRIMDKVSTAKGRLVIAGPKKARSLIKTVVRDLQHGVSRGKVDPSTGNSLIAMLGSALDNLQPLIKRR